MDFDPQVFLARYADAYNARDPESLRSFFALEDPRFGVGMLPPRRVPGGLILPPQGVHHEGAAS